MTAAKYNHRHQQARLAALARMADGQACCRCGRPMRRAYSHLLDLDHNDHDPTTYRGLAHRGCNRAAGAVKGNHARSAVRRAAASTLTTPAPAYRHRTRMPRTW
jgi:hypothetical protein